jgi:hypothetical protein
VAAELTSSVSLSKGLQDLIDCRADAAVKQFARPMISQLFAQLAGSSTFKLRMPMPNRTGQGASSSEAVATTGAAAWHQAGFTGKGVKVGVLDLGFDGYKSLLGKTLPERVTAKSFVSGHDADQSGEVHGTACAEIVHAMAPDATTWPITTAARPGWVAPSNGWSARTCRSSRIRPMD